MSHYDAGTCWASNAMVVCCAIITEVISYMFSVQQTFRP